MSFRSSMLRFCHFSIYHCFGIIAAMNGWRTLLLLLYLILGGSRDAFALRSAAPKNRCTPFFCTEVSRARYYKPDTGRFWTMDTFEGNSEDPLSLHKYLYCHDDPISRIDPSGHKSSFSAAELAEVGKEIHRRVGQDFVSKAAPGDRLTAESVFTLLGLPNPKSGAKDPAFGIKRLFPDLVDRKHKEVYEIKPLNLKGTATGVVQLTGYLVALNKLDPSGGWGVAIATEHYNSALVFFTARPFAAVVVAPPVLGMIFYEVESPQDFVKGRAKNVGQANQARIQQAWDTSALTSLMLGF
jgi:hypothetical protein